jgi:hypothetical protein
MTQKIKIDNKVIIMSQKDNIHPEVIGEKGIVKLIHNAEGTDLYYIQTDNYFEDLPPYQVLNIPQGYCYIAIYDELALIE